MDVLQESGQKVASDFCIKEQPGEAERTKAGVKVKDHHLSIGNSCLFFYRIFSIDCFCPDHASKTFIPFCTFEGKAVDGAERNYTVLGLSLGLVLLPLVPLMGVFNGNMVDL